MDSGPRIFYRILRRNDSRTQYIASNSALSRVLRCRSRNSLASIRFARQKPAGRARLPRSRVFGRNEGPHFRKKKRDGRPSRFVVPLFLPRVRDYVARVFRMARVERVGEAVARAFYRRRGLRDHPRVCGEHELDDWKGNAEGGSSPRVRGTRVAGARLQRARGIIPACAGNTQPRRAAFDCRRDHPRVCGEHTTTRISSGTTAGSSPRVRGTPQREEVLQAAGGIIPACAGNTPTSTRRSSSPRDHPRVCGEHLPPRLGFVVLPGSSPRVRGTPACTRRRRRRAGDHPRVCGEHEALLDVYDAMPGSSPRVRGTPEPIVFAVCDFGIIPACAGNTTGHVLSVADR